MKHIHIIIVALIITIGLLIREHLLRLESREQLLHAYTVFQMQEIENRALHYMKLKLDEDELGDFGEKLISGKEYEICIGVPSQHVKEFQEWMKPIEFGKVSIDGWPKESGSSTKVNDKEMRYRVYYGPKPDDWNDN